MTDETGSVSSRSVTTHESDLGDGPDEPDGSFLVERPNDPLADFPGSTCHSRRNSRQVRRFSPTHLRAGEENHQPKWP